MIIKLTECRHANGVEKDHFPIWVNMNNFVTMNKSINGGRDTHMKLVGSFIFVKETPEEIMKLMEPAPARMYNEVSVASINVPNTSVRAM